MEKRTLSKELIPFHFVFEKWETAEWQMLVIMNINYRNFFCFFGLKIFLKLLNSFKINTWKAIICFFFQWLAVRGAKSFILETKIQLSLQKNMFVYCSKERLFEYWEMIVILGIKVYLFENILELFWLEGNGNQKITISEFTIVIFVKPT